MWLIHAIADFGVAFLSGYLVLTGAFADFIETKVARNDMIFYSQDLSREIIPISDKRSSPGSIERILLENRRFQQAAVIASQIDEQLPALRDDLPLETVVREALVNIYCQYRTSEYVRTTTGSGFFIHPKGIILTNAHVAQFLLLASDDSADTQAECAIRTGDPATPQYIANLLYISPTWILENAPLITDDSPRGTGERDYALLFVSKSLDAFPLPDQFPIIPVDVNLLTHDVVGTSVVTAGYPAENFLRRGSDAQIPMVLASSTVDVLYTFGSNNADVFSITESPLGIHGASGGPVVLSNNKKAIGMIVTKGDADLQGSKSLRALTLSYIDRAIREETGFSLLENISGDSAFRGNIFRSVMTPFLAEILQGEIEGQEVQ